MDNLAKEYVIDFFSKKLMLFGNTPSAVGWSAKGQRQRYECITKLVNLENSSILDFGCGKGDFYSFLKERGIKAQYTGIDINESLIKTAAKNHPDAEFLTLDIDSVKIGRTFDYTILCGVFNLNIEGVKKSAWEYLTKLLGHTNKALVLNCLSAYSENKDINLVYFDPQELLSQALKITQSTSLCHNLIEGDIFLILGKNSMFTQRPQDNPERDL